MGWTEEEIAIVGFSRLEQIAVFEVTKGHKGISLLVRLVEARREDAYCHLGSCKRMMRKLHLL